MPNAYYSVDTYCIEESVGYLLSQVQLRLHDALNDSLAKTGISWPQMKVLLQLYYQRAETAADLCRCMASDTGSMTRMLDRLEEKGFLRRSRSAADRRVVKLELTEAGRALMPAMNEAVVSVLNHHLQHFEAAEVDLFKTLLRRVLATEPMPKAS